MAIEVKNAAGASTAQPDQSTGTAPNLEAALPSHFRFPTEATIEVKDPTLASFVSQLQTPPLDPAEKTSALTALQSLGQHIEEHSGSREDLLQCSRVLRSLCASTDEVDLKVGVFRALEQIGLREPETMALLRNEVASSEYGYVRGAAQQTFYALASREPDIRAA